MFLFLSCIFYFVNKIRKTCHRKKQKTESLKQPIYWLEKPVLYSCWLDHWKWLMPDLMHVVLEFLSNGEGLDHFLRHVLPELCKINVTCPKWVKWTKKGKFWLAQVSKININFELLKVSKMTSLKIYVSPVTEKLETSNLDTW